MPLTSRATRGNKAYRAILSFVALFLEHNELLQQFKNPWNTRTVTPLQSFTMSVRLVDSSPELEGAEGVRRLPPAAYHTSIAESDSFAGIRLTIQLTIRVWAELARKQSSRVVDCSAHQSRKVPEEARRHSKRSTKTFPEKQT